MRGNSSPPLPWLQRLRLFTDSLSESVSVIERLLTHILKSSERILFETAGRALNGDWEFAEQRGTPYGMARRLLRSPGGLPCTAPPWGVLNAVDADTGEKKWTIPTGRMPKLGDSPAPPASFGSIVLGGPIATAGELVFMAGSLEPAIYAYDVVTGRELWRGELPTSARSTPMTFRGPNGKQYVVIAAGGHGIPHAAPLGDYLVAFALP